MFDNSFVAYPDAASVDMVRHRRGLPVQGPRDELTILWTPVSPRVRAQEEVLLLTQINALRAAVTSFPAWAHLTKRQRKLVRKLDFLEMFLEQDSECEWGQERLSKDWELTPQSLFYVAGALVGPPGLNCLFENPRTSAR